VMLTDCSSGTEAFQCLMKWGLRVPRSAGLNLLIEVVALVRGSRALPGCSARGPGDHKAQMGSVVQRAFALRMKGCLPSSQHRELLQLLVTVCVSRRHRDNQEYVSVIQ